MSDVRKGSAAQDGNDRETRRDGSLVIEDQRDKRPTERQSDRRNGDYDNRYYRLHELHGCAISAERRARTIHNGIGAVTSRDEAQRSEHYTHQQQERNAPSGVHGGKYVRTWFERQL